MKLYKETGAVDPRPHRGGRKSSINSEEFRSYVAANPDKTLVEMGEHFGLSYEGVAYIVLHIMKYYSSVVRNRLFVYTLSYAFAYADHCG
ncbi:MAG: hypothetical protein Q9M17_08350, partial [Mariprofundus sp.]|nr:hypothetical protein [Mariprofundus sp.]